MAGVEAGVVGPRVPDEQGGHVVVHGDLDVVVGAVAFVKRLTVVVKL